MFKAKALYRIIDANLNRAREGLRVCEEISRFILNDKKNSLEFKMLRHRLQKLTTFFPAKNLFQARDTQKDAGKKSIGTEFKRKDYRDLFFANIQRTKESLRVLEEFSKLINKNLSEKFKKIRYKLYLLEKKISCNILN